MRNVLAAAVLFATAAFAQTSSDCNPLSKTDCPVNPAIGMSNWTWIPDGSLNSKIWNDTGYVGTTAGSGYVNFTMSKTKDAPTIKTKAYFFFGSVSVVAQMAPGTGVISAITLLSDDLDEIDFEFKGGEKNRVFTNYYGKHGNQDKPQGGMKDGDGADFPTSFDVTTGYHNYTINWSNDTIQWLVDDKVIRTSKSSDEKAQGGKTFPQTPMSLYLGNWAGGDSSEPGTVSWAGGKTDWSKAPFMMSVKSVYVSDAMGGSSGPVKEYKYGDTSGSAKSIQITKADSGQNSTFASAVAAQETDNTSLTDKAKASYNNLSTGAKIGIACGVLGVVALGVIIMAICCIKQRRAGRRERAVADAEFQKQEAELMAYRQANGQRQAFVMPAFGHQNYKQHM